PELRYPDVPALAAALDEALARGSPLYRAQAAAPAVASAAQGQQRQSMGMVFFRSAEDMGEVRTALSECGGQLAHARAGACVAVFGHEEGGDPIGRAVRAAAQLVERRLAG